MLKFLLLCLLATSQGISARPAHSVPSDLASHILIVTPQAQVHLEPALKYDAVAPAAFIQHLSPLARIAAPHDETIIYVPSGAAVDASAVSVARSAPTLTETQLPQRKQETKQYEQISQQIEQAQAAIQQGSSAVGPQLSEAANAAASAASNAGSGFFPALFPPAAGVGPAASATAGGNLKDDKIKGDKILYEGITTLTAATPLLPGAGVAEARRFYALTPAVSHVIDFVHAPVFVGPVSAIRARSIPAAADSETEQSDKGVTAAATQSANDKLKSTDLSANDFREKEKDFKGPELAITEVTPAASAADLSNIEPERIKDKEQGERARDKDRTEQQLRAEEEKILEEKKIILPLQQQQQQQQQIQPQPLLQLQSQQQIQPQTLEKQAIDKEQQQQQQQKQALQQPQPAQPAQQQQQERRDELKELESLKQSQQQQQQQPIQALSEPSKQQQIQSKEKLLDKPEQKELKEKRDEIKEEKKDEEPQLQKQLLKEDYKKENNNNNNSKYYLY